MQLSASATRARLLLTILFWLILFALVAERAGYAGVYSGTASLRSAAAQATLGAPSVLYLGALWQLRSLAGRVAMGEAFAPACGIALRWSGVLLMVGAALALLVIPVALPLAEARHIGLDVATLIIGAIGLALLLIARLLDQARAVQGELDEFF